MGSDDSRRARATLLVFEFYCAGRPAAGTCRRGESPAFIEALVLTDTGLAILSFEFLVALYP